jgi:hypothetical protein
MIRTTLSKQFMRFELVKQFFSAYVEPGGEVQSRGARGSAGAHLSWEVRFGAIRHMAAPEPISAER